MHIGILHPGEMGAVVGGLLVREGHSVYWASQGRSPQTTSRAQSSRLQAVDSLQALTDQVEVIFTICPPESALKVAEDVAEAGFGGLFVDANAVSPETARRIAACVEAAGAASVDAGIVGPPPLQSGSTRLYVCGADTAKVEALFANTHIDTVVIEGEIGAASALKICYAAWTKGSSALILAIRAMARAEGVDAPLISEWRASQPALESRLESALAMTPGKAWRFEGEMREIAESFGAAGLPRGFHQAAAEVFTRLGVFKNTEPPDLEAVMKTLLAGATEALPRPQ